MDGPAAAALRAGYLAPSGVDVLLTSVSLSALVRCGPLASRILAFRGRLESMGAEPRMNSFGNGSPFGLEHHVMTHVGEEFGLGPVRTRHSAYFVRGDASVTLRTQDKHRRCYR